MSSEKAEKHKGGKGHLGIIFFNPLNFQSSEREAS